MRDSYGRRFRRAAGLTVLTVLAVLASGACGSRDDERGRLLVLVERRLAPPLAAELTRFRADLAADGYQVTVRDDLTDSTPPAQVRALVQEERRRGGRITGAILIGEIGALLFNQHQWQNDPYWHDYLSDLYYMDLDGYWGDADGNGVFETHRSYGSARLSAFIEGLARKTFSALDRRAPELWVSRLRAGTLPGLGDELVLFKDYFEKNHRYRTGALAIPPPRAFVVSAGVDALVSGWGARPGQLFPTVHALVCGGASGESLRTFLGSRDGYQLGVISEFSGPRIHHFGWTGPHDVDDAYFASAEGRSLVTAFSDTVHYPGDVTSAQVHALQPKVLFYQVISSETGRHDQRDYLAGAYVFSGLGLAAIAGTQHSGAVGVPVLYDELARNLPMGEAWKRALVWSLHPDGKPLVQLRCEGRQESYDPAPDAYKAVLIGDGTLRLPARGVTPARLAGQ